MPTKNIECQLAQGQIGRYLNGERFSPQAITQLEAHVADCDECSELVTRRRQALMAMLGEGATHAAVMAPTGPTKPVEPEAPATSSAKDRLMAKLKQAETPGAQVNDQVAPTGNPATRLFGELIRSKPLLYCAGLAAVLAAMSYYSKTALKAFGPTAESYAVETPHTYHTSSTPTPPVPATSDPKPPAAGRIAVVPLKTPGKPIARTADATPIDDGLDDLTEETAPKTANASDHALKLRHKAKNISIRRRVSKELRLSSIHKIHRTARTHRIVPRRHHRYDNDQLSRPKSHGHTSHWTRPSKSVGTIRIYDAEGRSVTQ